MLHALRSSGSPATISITFLILVFALCSCRYKKVADLNARLKGLDHITVIPPVLNLRAIGAENEIVDELPLHKQVTDSIWLLTEKLLRKKYTLSSHAGFNVLSAAQLDSLKKQIVALDKSKKKLGHFSLDTSIYSRYNKDNNRYLLIYYLEGLYRTRAKRKEINIAMAPVVVASVILSSGTGILLPRHSVSQLRTMLYDHQERKVVYFHCTDKSDRLLWQRETVRLLVYEGCKKLYYR
jgi:hypothetical protein